MADNFVVNGTTIRAKDIGGIYTQAVWIEPEVSSGLATYHFVSAASTNVGNIKASAGQVFGITVYSVAAYPIYVKFHNTSGTPTAGTGVVRTFGVQSGMPFHASFPYGIAFSTGIGHSIVKGITEASAVAIAASDCVVDIDWK